ncbi:sugar-transfer associated ATP-grasp domain-containing protein [Erythrobacter aureus]|uniref:Alpha-L-glutamate ligase-related protein ATP-grasp domain-containing protein n=1 Tax=Erythrobacter aureus TaxID=2182384 RepID=A0A345YFI1_9SPHN|nr:sugar-transfer associated ATP-grasp domain-containing protein [Erythrobacter aureus]AXK42683.1 hypothetical protein DVR09_10380 [Erythrobacter aureus]
MKRLYDLVRLNFAIYPGIVDFRSAAFLDPYYARMRRGQGPLRIAFNALFYAAFRLFIVLRARKVARKWGWSKPRRLEAVRICLSRFADPGDVALYDIRGESDFDTVMRRFEHVGVSRAIANPATDHDPAITDKGEFYRVCAHAGLPHPRVLAERSDKDGWKIFQRPEAGPFLLKPIRGSGGAGIELIAAQPDDLEPTGFLRMLEETKTTGGWIAQDLLRPHPDIADIALDALPTSRITTILDERGKPELVTAVLRLAAQPGVIVDNAHAGGIFSAIDFETGELGLARYATAPGEFDRHPANDRPIPGRRIPDWPALRRLALDAHADHFPAHVQIGWDVAPSDRGPMLIEANARPNVRVPQRATGLGIGATRHGELIRYHLENRTATGRRFLTEA